MLKFCPKCGATLKEGAVFCPKCGQRIVINPENEPNIDVYSRKNQQTSYTPQSGLGTQSSSTANSNYSYQPVAVEGSSKRRTAFPVILFVLALLILAGAGFAYFRFIRPEMRYNKAKNLISESRYDEALEILSELGDYKDSDYLINSLYTG